MNYDKLTINEVLELHPLLGRIDTELLLEYLSTAFDYVTGKIKLQPTVIQMTSIGDTVNMFDITDNVFIHEDGPELKIKEIKDVIGELNSMLIFDPFVHHNPIVNDMAVTTGTYLWKANQLYVKGSVQVVCYLYPTLTNRYSYTITEEDLDSKLNPVLMFPVIAYVYSLIHHNTANLTQAHNYENVCIRYINLYNSEVIEPHVSIHAKVSTVVPYVL